MVYFLFITNYHVTVEPTDDSVEIAVNFVKEVGQLLEELSPQGLHAIFERFRGILHEGIYTIYISLYID